MSILIGGVPSPISIGGVFSLYVDRWLYGTIAQGGERLKAYMGFIREEKEYSLGGLGA